MCDCFPSDRTTVPLCCPYGPFLFSLSIICSVLVYEESDRSTFTWVLASSCPFLCPPPYISISVPACLCSKCTYCPELLADSFCNCDMKKSCSHKEEGMEESVLPMMPRRCVVFQYRIKSDFIQIFFFLIFLVLMLKETKIPG